MDTLFPMQDNTNKMVAATLGIMDIKNEINYHKENRIKGEWQTSLVYGTTEDDKIRKEEKRNVSADLVIYADPKENDQTVGTKKEVQKIVQDVRQNQDHKLQKDQIEGIHEPYNEVVKKNENEDYVRNATILETSYEDNEEADNKVDETVHDIYDKKHDKGKKADCNATNIQNNNVAVA